MSELIVESTYILNCTIDFKSLASKIQRKFHDFPSTINGALEIKFPEGLLTVKKYDSHTKLEICFEGDDSKFSYDILKFVKSLINEK